jgi:uncharacterized protein YndB with AHSA1/START domain
MTPSEAAATRNETVFSTPSDYELVTTRTFDAPRSLVWAVFTDPKHIPHWQTGPEGLTMPVCEIDLRTGGSWRYVWRNAHGREFEASGRYLDVTPPERIVTVAGKSGEENTITTVFAEHDGRTTVTATNLFASKASRDQAIPYAKGGTASSYTRLDAYLASTRRSA